MSTTPSSPPAPPTPRRRALVLATCAGACAVALAVTGPAFVLALAPLKRSRSSGRWVRTVRLDQLKEGEPRRVPVIADRRDAWTVEVGIELGSVWLVRRGDGVVAFSAVCPHLGCSVNAAPPSGVGGFACPCHTSSFDGMGKRVSGPSPRDLDVLATRIDEGWVIVEFRRFRIGTAEKVET